MVEDGKCEDIDECQKDKICGSNQICINNPGRYSCLCDDGYEPMTIGSVMSTVKKYECKGKANTFFD